MKKASIYFAVLNVLIISAISFGQTYNGPAAGNVSSGIEVTTDDFLFTATGSESSEPLSVMKFMEYKSGPVYYDGDQAVFNNYVYVEDENANMKSGEMGEILLWESGKFMRGMLSGEKLPLDKN